MYKVFPLFLLAASSLAPNPPIGRGQTYTADLKGAENIAGARTPTTVNGEAKALYKTGLDLLDSGQVAQAVTSFEQALKLDPEYADAYEALGRAYFKMREWQKAINSFHRAAGLNTKVKQDQDELHKTLLTRNPEAANQPPPPIAKTEAPIDTAKTTQPRSSISQAQSEPRV